MDTRKKPSIAKMKLSLCPDEQYDAKYYVKIVCLSYGLECFSEPQAVYLETLL